MISSSDYFLNTFSITFSVMVHDYYILGCSGIMREILLTWSSLTFG